MVRTISGKILVASFVCVLTVIPNKRSDASAVAGSLEVTQVVNMLQLFYENATTVLQLAEDEATKWSLVDEKVRGVLAPVFEAKQRIDEVRDTVRQGQSIAYSLQNIDQVMLDKYKSFDDFMLESYDAPTYAADIRAWSETTRDSITAALKGAGIQVDDMDNEESIMEQLYNNIENSSDRQAAMDVANDIAHFNSKQLQSLRQLAATQMQITAAYYQEQNSRDAVTDAQWMEFTAPSGINGPPPIINSTLGNEQSFPNMPPVVLP